MILNIKEIEDKPQDHWRYIKFNYAKVCNYYYGIGMLNVVVSHWITKKLLTSFVPNATKEEFWQKEAFNHVD